MKLWILTPDEWETRVQLPEKTTADILLRRVQKFTLAPGEEFTWTLGDEDGTSAADEKGYPVIEGIEITQDAKILTIKK